jgi:hypothetical protein
LLNMTRPVTRIACRAPLGEAINPRRRQRGSIDELRRDREQGDTRRVVRVALRGSMMDSVSARVIAPSVTAASPIIWVPSKSIGQCRRS